MRRLQFLVVLALIIGSTAGVQAGPEGVPGTPAAVDRQVWRQVARSPTRQATFVVVMQEGPEAGPASAIPAQMGLEGPLEALQRAGSVSAYTIFYGANAITVTGTGSAVRFLAAWPGVSAVRGYAAADAALSAATVEDAPDASGHITGAVTAADGVTPLAGIQVTAYRQTGVTTWVVQATGSTGTGGAYDIGALPGGIYRAKFSDPAGNRVPEFYNDKTDFNQATNFTVVDGQTTPNINAALALAGHVAGTVTSVKTGSPVADIVVSAWQSVDGQWRTFGGGVSGASGAYDVGGLAAGTYRIKFADAYSPPRYLSEYYNNVLDISQATPVNVVAGQTTQPINASLGEYGKLTGTVTAPDGTTALEAIIADIYWYNTTWQDWELVSYGDTNAAGQYEARGLDTRDYRVEFSDPLGQFAGEFYDNKPDIESATPVHVDLGFTTAGINASLEFAVMTATLPLASGWNLISLSMIPSSPQPGNALASISGGYESVWAWDGCDTLDHWKLYNPDIPVNPPSDLTALDEKQGYWLDATAAATLVVAGTRPFATNIPLCVGWNLIGYPSGVSRPVTEALAGIAGKYNLVYAYVATDVADPWKRYNPSVSVGNDLATMQAGLGYWIRMTQAATLTVHSR